VNVGIRDDRFVFDVEADHLDIKLIRDDLIFQHLIDTGQPVKWCIRLDWLWISLSHTLSVRERRIKRFPGVATFISKRVPSFTAGRMSI